MRSYDTYDSPQGRMLLVADDDGLSGVYFEKQKHFGGREKNWRHDPHQPVLARAKRELAEGILAGDVDALVLDDEIVSTANLAAAPLERQRL